MSTCHAKLDSGRECNTQMFKCTTCGARGYRNDDCKNQGFSTGFTKCLSCNASSGITTA